MPMLSLKESYDHAKALYDKGFYRAALHASQVLYKQQPHHPPVVALYIGSMLRVQRHADGVRIATRALRHITFKEHRVAIITQLSEGLTQSGQLDEAIKLVSKELETQVDHHGLIGAYTHLLVMNDQKEDAIAYIDELRERGVESLSIAAVFGRAVLRTDRRDEAIEWIQRLIEERPDANSSQKHHVYNSLGHLLDRAKRYDEAMEAFKISNEQVDPSFDDRREEVVENSIKEHWTLQRVAGVDRAAPSGPRPVFIVGMPRSGTTLTEQIIDAHPKGYGAGELGLISELFRSIAKTPDNTYDTGPDQYEPGDIERVARIYREETAALADNPDVEVIVDKAPMNFHYLGMIALAFPDAKIIH